MDVFTEYMVKKQKSGKDVFLQILCGVSAAAVIVVALLLIPIVTLQFGQIGSMYTMLAPLIALGAGYGAWYLISSMNVEYEYILTNGEMDVDKIVARRRRKRMITVNARKFEAFGPYTPERITPAGYTPAFLRRIPATTTPSSTMPPSGRPCWSSPPTTGCWMGCVDLFRDR